jgi:hypothetical protein
MIQRQKAPVMPELFFYHHKALFESQPLTSCIRTDSPSGFLIEVNKSLYHIAYLDYLVLRLFFCRNSLRIKTG